MAGCRTRLAGGFPPGEILRLRVRGTADGYRLTATAAERDDAPVLADARITACRTDARIASPPTESGARVTPTESGARVTAR
ncbi:hypothetical protein AB0B30_13375 [Streptomyces narbonensis]|uniref:Uncharacterized protein n=1 Tax=Streptomyces narbonensis TaxID=67333 RepID=A0ABV3CIM4_9ACTN